MTDFQNIKLFTKFHVTFSKAICYIRETAAPIMVSVIFTFKYCKQNIEKLTFSETKHKENRAVWKNDLTPIIYPDSSSLQAFRKSLSPNIDYDFPRLKYCTKNRLEPFE